MRYSIKPLNRFSNLNKIIIEAANPALALEKFLKANNIESDAKRVTRKVEDTLKSKGLEISSILDFIVYKECSYVHNAGGRYILTDRGDNNI